VTYVAPLAFVLCVTMGKEAYDDYLRYKRDVEANSAKYLTLPWPSSSLHAPSMTASSSSTNIGAGLPTRVVPSSSLRVGDLVLLHKDQRVPADMVLLRTSDTSGTCFVRTDQLDGETDWKLRVAVPATQALPSDDVILGLDGEVYADAPSKDIHSFIGTFTLSNNPPSSALLGDEDREEEEDVPMMSVPSVEPLSAENVLWANTVLASGSAVGVIVYTGKETRAVMNTSHPATKAGLLDIEINRLAKVGSLSLCSGKRRGLTKRARFSVLSRSHSVWLWSR
jgi:phospholipid-translocating ATPase